jgi:hypothetical protein
VNINTRHQLGEIDMTKFNAKTAIAAILALAGLTAAAPAGAAPLRHHAAPSYQTQAPGPGYYEGEYEYDVDRSDRASSPYAGGPG